MFTKKNSRRDSLLPTLDALVLHLGRALIFFHQDMFNAFSELFFFIYQKYKIKSRKQFLYIQNSSLHKTIFPYDIKNSPNAFLLKLSFITHL